LWWRADGSLAARSMFDDDGQLHGICRRFHPDETVSLEAPFQRGKAHGQRFHTRSKSGGSPEDVHLDALPLPGVCRIDQLHIQGQLTPFQTLYGREGRDAPVATRGGRAEDLAANLTKMMRGTTFTVRGGALRPVEGPAIPIAWDAVVYYVGLAAPDATRFRLFFPGGAAVTVDRAEVNRALLLTVDFMASRLPPGPPPVRLGVVPGPDADEGGFQVGRVQPGSSAERAGIRQEDTIVRVGDRVLATASDYWEALAALKGLPVLEIELRRKGRREVVTAQL